MSKIILFLCACVSVYSSILCIYVFMIDVCICLHALDLFFLSNHAIPSLSILNLKASGYTLVQCINYVAKSPIIFELLYYNDTTVITVHRIVSNKKPKRMEAKKKWKGKNSWLCQFTIIIIILLYNIIHVK